MADTQKAKEKLIRVSHSITFMVHSYRTSKSMMTPSSSMRWSQTNATVRYRTSFRANRKCWHLSSFNTSPSMRISTLRCLKRFCPLRTYKCIHLTCLFQQWNHRTLLFLSNLQPIWELRVKVTPIWQCFYTVKIWLKAKNSNKITLVFSSKTLISQPETNTRRQTVCSPNNRLKSSITYLEI